MAEPQKQNLWVRVGQLPAVAWEFFGAILAGAIFGYVTDRYLATSPWGLIVCTLLGSSTGLYRMILMLRQLEKKSND